MKYISVGAVVKQGTEHIVDVSHCGNEFRLTGALAYMWLSGRFGFSKSENGIEDKALAQLHRMDLIRLADSTEAGEYRALTQCVLVPAEKKQPYIGLLGRDRVLLTWLRETGLRLTMAELVFLMDRNIMPEARLLNRDDPQALIETIYTRENIMDNILECQMEHVPVRDEVVKRVLQLLKKKRIVLL